MKQAIFNNLINLSYPDDFKELSDKENEKYFSGDLMRLSFHSEDKHVLMSISKSKDSFMNRLVNIASVLVGSVGNLESSLKEYKQIEEYESIIFDTNAITECFEYLASDDGSRQYGELTIFKVRKAFYIIYCLCRYDNKEEAKKIFKDFKESFKDEI